MTNTGNSNIEPLITQRSFASKAFWVNFWTEVTNSPIEADLSSGQSIAIILRDLAVVSGLIGFVIWLTPVSR